MNAIHIQKKLIFIGNMCLLFCLLLVVSACGHKQPRVSTSQLYLVKVEDIHKTLYFTGTIQPLHTSTLTNSMDAVIETMHSHYGQTVKKGDTVFTLNSPELQKQYNETLTDYLKAKDNFTIVQSKFTGMEELWQAGLISKNTYLSEQSGLNTAKVTLMQATHKLSEMLEKMGEGNYENLSSLSFAQFNKVRRVLTSKHNLIYIKAPRDGVLLYPPKNEEKTAQLTVGATVKTGQVLALIGDLTGVRVEIDVPEVDIEQIKPGLQAVVRSVAFPKEAMQGELVSMNAQASTNNNSALSSFTAVVEVKQLSASQQAWMKVGMSASIELVISNPQKLAIPIAAIKKNGTQSMVQLQTGKGRFQAQVVVTGAALADKVLIESGLKEGDVILIE